MISRAEWFCGTLLLLAWAWIASVAWGEGAFRSVPFQIDDGTG